MSAVQRGFWDVEERLAALSQQGDPLERLAATVDFEIFRSDLKKALGQADRSKGGRPPFNPVLKFRMLVLQAMHGLALAQMEFLVADRLSWMRFCRLGPGHSVPDANTLWDFREALIAAGALEALFARLDRAITEAGYLPMSGQIVDATPVAAPRQRLPDGFERHGSAIAHRRTRPRAARGVEQDRNPPAAGTAPGYRRCPIGSNVWNPRLPAAIMALGLALQTNGFGPSACARRGSVRLPGCTFSIVQQISHVGEI